MSDTDTTQETPPTETEGTPDTGTDETTDYKAEAEKWKALARKHENAAKKQGQKLQEIEDAGKSEAQKEADRRAQSEKERDEARRDAMKARIALRKAASLTDEQREEFLNRLRGDTEEELTEDADRLLKLFKPGTPSGDADGGSRGKPPDSSTDMNALLRKAALGR